MKVEPVKYFETNSFETQYAYASVKDLPVLYVASPNYCVSPVSIILSEFISPISFIVMAVFIIGGLFPNNNDKNNRAIKTSIIVSALIFIFATIYNVVGLGLNMVISWSESMNSIAIVFNLCFLVVFVAALLFGTINLIKISRLKKENNCDKEEKLNKRKQTYIIITIVSLVMVVMASFFYLNRKCSGYDNASTIIHDIFSSQLKLLIVVSGATFMISLLAAIICKLKMVLSKNLEEENKNRLRQMIKSSLVIVMYSLLVTTILCFLHFRLWLSDFVSHW